MQPLSQRMWKHCASAEQQLLQNQPALSTRGLACGSVAVWLRCWRLKRCEKQPRTLPLKWTEAADAGG